MYLFYKRGFTPAPWTLLVISVVLLQSLYGVSNPFCPQLYIVQNFSKHCHYNTFFLEFHNFCIKWIWRHWMYVRNLKIRLKSILSLLSWDWIGQTEFIRSKVSRDWNVSDWIQLSWDWTVSDWFVGTESTGLRKMKYSGNVLKILGLYKLSKLCKKNFAPKCILLIHIFWISKLSWLCHAYKVHRLKSFLKDYLFKLPERNLLSNRMLKMF